MLTNMFPDFVLHYFEDHGIDPKELIEHPTEELWLKAIKGMPYLLKKCPIESEDIYREVLSQGLTSGLLLEFVPEHMRSEDLCHMAVNATGSALEFVPEHLRSEELCFIAVRKCGHALAFVPEHLVSKEMCLDAVRCDGCAIQHSPFFTEDICFAALDNNPYALKHIPNPTDDMIYHAIKLDPQCIKIIPNPDPDLCMNAISLNARAILSIETPTPDMMWKAIQTDPDVIIDCDTLLLTEDMEWSVIKRYPSYIQFTRQTPEMCEYVLNINLGNLKFIKKPPLDICHHALDVNVFYFAYMPPLPELYEHAIASGEHLSELENIYEIKRNYPTDYYRWAAPYRRMMRMVKQRL